MNNNHMIDLIPYLPQQAPAEKKEHRKSWLQGISCAIESVTTLCIGAGFFIMLAAFFAVML